MQFNNFSVFFDIIDKFCTFIVDNPILQIFIGLGLFYFLYKLFLKIFGIKSITEKIEEYETIKENNKEKNKSDFDYFFDNERFNYVRKGSDRND